MRIIFINILFVTLSSLVNAGEFNTAYDKYMINTVGDYLRVCEPIAKKSTPSYENSNKILSCLSFIAGVLKGYTGTLSVKAEYALAKKNSVSRTEMISELKNSPSTQKKLDKIYFSSHFLCFERGIGFYDIANKIYIGLNNSKADVNIDIDDILLNEMEKFLLCHYNKGK